jgi:hypothetical protein
MRFIMSPVRHREPSESYATLVFRALLSRAAASCACAADQVVLISPSEQLQQVTGCLMQLENALRCGLRVGP